MNLWKYINNYDNTLKLLHNILIYSFVGIRRDLVSEPRKPDVYLAVNLVAFGSQLDDEIDENERCVFRLIVHFKWRHIISTNRRLSYNVFEFISELVHGLIDVP